ncbi:hypothetical protein [Tenacibaculum jejuense]|uniref:hypothetical protein n=1 Tax=Tenacibaculum jejuense TaxID=584609 RepID=UPI0012FDF9F9|nr:hypothetical protein [Tenacibaculum jejuense]
MLKNISNLGTVLNKSEQQFINGAKRQAPCHFSATHDCDEGPASEYCKRNPNNPFCKQ